MYRSSLDPELHGNLVSSSNFRLALPTQLALHQGPDQIDRQLLSGGNGRLGGVAGDVQENDAAVLARLVEVSEAGKVDKVAQVAARILGYAKVGPGLALLVSNWL